MLRIRDCPKQWKKFTIVGLDLMYIVITKIDNREASNLIIKYIFKVCLVNPFLLYLKNKKNHPPAEE